MSSRKLTNSVTGSLLSSEDDEMYDTHRGLTYKDIIARDVIRFAAADLDGDKQLTKNELADFLHPG